MNMENTLKKLSQSLEERDKDMGSRKIAYVWMRTERGQTEWKRESKKGFLS
jgi:hypothetical protein